MSIKASRRAFLGGALATVAVAATGAAAVVTKAVDAVAKTDWVPTGWLPLHGQVVSRTAYPRLFAAIWANYGADDDLTFKLPDFRGPTTAWPLDNSPSFQVEHIINAGFSESVPAGMISTMAVPSVA